MRSEREKLGREESIAFESRHIRWTATYAPETDTEEFLVHANVFVASEMERAKSAYLECAQNHVDTAEYAEIERVHDTGNRLFFDPRGVPFPLYGTRPFDPKKLGTSWSSEHAPALDPGESAVEPADALTDEVANCEAEASRLDQAGECEANLNAGCAAPVIQEAREEAVDSGPAEEIAEVSGASQTSEKAPNEANFRDDVCIAQHEDAIDVPTNSAALSGLDKLQTNPILETKPIPAGGPEPSTIGESAEPRTPCLNERERRAAWIEMRRQEWIRSRAAKEARERKHASAVDAGTTHSGVGPGDAAGEAVLPQDARGP